MEQTSCSNVTQFPLQWDRHPSSVRGSCRYKRPSKPMQVAVINIDRIPAPTTNIISRISNCSVKQTTSNRSLAKEQRFPPSGSLPSSPSSGGVNLQTNSANVSSTLPKAMQTKINHLVSSPFKQSTVSRLHHVHCFSPGEEWKFEILNEIEQMKKLQSDQRPVYCHRILTGQLLKARLKPLYPVVGEGPSITQCRGFLTRSNPRRGMRFHEYLSYDGYVRETPDTLHQTSISSWKDKEISET